MSTPSIFLSYRRDDGIDTAQLLQLNLQRIFGEDSVFLDTNSIKAGDDFPDHIRNAMQNSKVVIVMIGKNWKGSNQNRLASENDWVRKELEMALEKSNAGKKIFPVLIKGATVEASFKDLPSSLERLSTFNCAALREKEFSQDLLQLIPLIEAYVDTGNPLRDLPLDEKTSKYPMDSPFKGLDYFTENDANIFFGRGHEIRQIYNIICERNIVLFYGQTGVGKSSLLFAGLKPRMNCKGWEIKYFRREKGVNLALKLHEHISNVKPSEKQLLILDQVEEIYTNADSNISTKEEAEQLFKGVGLAIDKKFKVILSFRKEYFAEFNNLFKPLNAEDFYLKPLVHTGVLNAIRGVTEQQKGRDLYQLDFADNSVPSYIAQAILSDEQSHVAPLLQILLRKMWDKVSDKKPRIFSKGLFEDVKSNSLATLLNAQIARVSEKFPCEAASGLILDLLYYFTTTRGTSASHTERELSNRYESIITIQVVTELKNKYLLSEPKTENINISRLAHDALAPIIREVYLQSTLPGQRASILLESKKHEIELKPHEVEFSKPDLAIIDSGKSGMRKWTEIEINVIETSRKKIIQHELELEEKNRQLEEALTDVKEQVLQAKAKAMAATARGVSETDPTLGIRLAEASMQITSSPTIESRLAFVDIIKSNKNFCKKIFSFDNQVDSCRFSPDGQHILVTNGAGALLLDFQGEVIQVFKGHGARVSSIAFSPDGKYILTGSWDNTARLWDLNGNSIQVFNGHAKSLCSVAFSPDGKSVITGSYDSTIKLWDLNGKTIQSFDGVYGFCPAVFSPDGKFILAGSEDKTARLWDLNGKTIQVFEGHTKTVYSVAFSPNGESVLTGSGDKTARLWDLNGKHIQVFEGHNSGLASVGFSPDNRFILTGSEDKTARLWDLNGKLNLIFKGHLHRLYSAIFSPDGNLVLTGSFDRTMRLWDLRNNISKIVYRVEESTSFFDSFPLSPDGKTLLAFRSKENIPALFDLKGDIIQTFKGHSSLVTAASFSPDGKYLLTASEDNTARLWNLKGNTIRIYKHEHSKHLGLVGLAFSNNGKFFLTRAPNGIVYFWNLKGKLIRAIKTDAYLVGAVAFSPDDTQILIGGGDETAVLLDITGKIIRVFKGHSSPVVSVAFSGENKYILTGSMDNTARLWDINSADILQVFEHSATVDAVAFSSDGNTIVTCCEDEPTQIWSLYWKCLDTNNTAIPSLEQMKKYDIPSTIEWGKK